MINTRLFWLMQTSLYNKIYIYSKKRSNFLIFPEYTCNFNRIADNNVIKKFYHFDMERRLLTLTHHWASSTILTRKTVVKVVVIRFWNFQECTHHIIVCLFIRKVYLYIYKVDIKAKSRFSFLNNFNFLNYSVIFNVNN